MALRVHELIPEPCPVAWEELLGDGAQRFCARCSKSVHDLSGRSEAELRAVLAKGESICVQLVVDRSGVVITPAFVPVSRLRAPAIAATTLAVLAACTPHARPDEPAPEPAPVVVVGAEHDVVVARPAPMPEPETYRMGGAILGKPGIPTARHEVSAKSVPCDTLPSSAHGRPSELDAAGRVLLDDRELAKADLLARCEP